MAGHEADAAVPTGDLPAPPDRLRAAYDSMFDPHVLLLAVRSVDGNIADLMVVDANSVVETSTGLRREQVLGQRLGDLFPLSRSSGLIDRCISVLEGGAALTMTDVPSFFAGDAEIRLDVRAVQVGDAVSVTWRDVTERHRYQLLAELSSDVVFRNRVDGTVEWVSPSIATVMGWRPDQIVGRPTLDFVHPDDLAVLQAARSTLQSGSEVRYEARFLRAEGGSRWMEVVARPLVDEATGMVVARIGSMRDIEAQVADREALVHAKDRAVDLNRRLEALLELGDIVALRVGLDGVIQDVTSSVQSVLGHRPEQLIGTPARTWLHPGDLASAGQVVWSLQPGEHEETRARISDASGTYRQLAGTILRSVDRDTGEDGFEIVLVDVTEQARAAKAREQLGVMASQEIRGPLAVIYGGLDMLESGRVSLDDQRGRDLLRRMSGAAKRLTGVVESWGKAQRADTVASVEPLPQTDVRAVIDHVVDSVSRDCDVRIVVDDRATDGLHRGIDPDQLAQAVRHVLTNAALHSPPGGQVDLTLDALAGGMRVTVRDRGADSPNRSRRNPAGHFAMVTQDDRDLVVGKDLAVAAAIAVAHAGRLTAEDPADGTGAQFAMELHELRPGS